MDTMKKTILSIFAFSLFINLNAQNTYSLLRNEPFELKNLSFTFIPLIIKPNTLGKAFGAMELKAHYRYKNKWGVDGSIQKNVFGENKSDFEFDKYKKIQPAYEGKKETDAFLLGRYYFKKTVKDHKAKVTLDLRRTNKGGRVETYTKIPVQMGILYAFRAGVNMGIRQIHFKESKADFSGGLVDDPMQTKLFNGNGTIYTNLNYKVISLGLSKTWLTDICINVDNFGERSTMHLTEVYVDLLYGPQITMDNIYYSQTYVYGEYRNFAEYDINDNKKRRLGFRVGIVSHSLNVFGFYNGLELGILPGPSMNNFIHNSYIAYKLGLNFSFKK